MSNQEIKLNILDENELYKLKTKQLKIMAKNISQEGWLNNVFGAIPKAILYAVANVYKVISNRLESWRSISFEHDQNVYVKELLKIKPGKVKEISSYNYNLVKDQRFPTVVGLKVNFIIGADEVTEGLKLIEKHVEEAVKSLDELIGKIVTDEGYRTSTRPRKVNDVAAKLNSELDKKLKRCFNPKDVVDTKLFSEIYPNMSCLNPIYDRLTTHGQFVNLHNMKTLDRFGRVIHGKIDGLLRSMTEGDMNISKPVLISLQHELEDVADMITNISSYIHWYDQSVMVFTKTLEMCEEIKKKTK